MAVPPVDRRPSIHRRSTTTSQRRKLRHDQPERHTADDRPHRGRLGRHQDRQDRPGVSGRPDRPAGVATVKTGMFGSKESFAPLYGSKPVGEDLQLAVSKDLVKDLPPKAGRVSRRSLPTETGANWSTSPGGRPSVRSRGPVPMRDNRPSDSVSGQGCRSACSYCKAHLPDQDS
jgi:hypothetical protein